MSGKRRRAQEMATRPQQPGLSDLEIRPTRASRPLCVIAVLLAISAGAYAGPAQKAQAILRATGVTGGLIVHVGCGDGKLTTALASRDGVLVHGLDADAANVAKTRARIQAAGIYGKASAEAWDGASLPYTDNLVRLLVAEGAVPDGEAMRVLTPGGVLYARSGNEWLTTVKPVPSDIDDWTHSLHDASNNAVAQDEVVGPPHHLQWLAEPKHARHHERLASISVVVSAGGKLFYIVDEAPTASVLLRPDWQVVARDAFSGIVLWKRPISTWESHLRPFRSGPAALSRRMVAVGDRVYVTLGNDAAVTALDAATGEVAQEHADTNGAEEILVDEGTLYVVVAPSVEESARRTGEVPTKPILAIDAETGDVLWQETNARPMPNTLAVSGDGVFYLDVDGGVVGLDAKTGSPRWSVQREVALPRPGWSSPTLVAHDDVVLCADRDVEPLGDFDEQTNAPIARWLAQEGWTGDLIAYDAETGDELWKTRVAETYHSQIDVFVADGLVWSGRSRSRTHGDFTEGRDPHTGEVKRTINTDVAFDTTMPHHRCHRNRATERYLVTGRTGVEFIDVRTGDSYRHSWTRGTCQFGSVPANGLLYVPPHSCACHIEAKLAGFYAYAPKRDVASIHSSRDLTTGPAFGSALAGDPGESDWPTYRHDAARDGSTSSVVSADLAPHWQADLGGRLSSPVIADERVYVASVDAHAINALDAASGNSVWAFTAGGRVDSPPTVSGGRVVFGSADGHVYCLRASDGELIWRLRVAPEDRRGVVRDQLESAWPVHGSVLVQDGAVYCAAGRSSYLDGGIRLCRIDLETGGKLAERRVYSRDEGTGRQPDDMAQFELEGALPDILSSDGELIYMRKAAFDAETLEPAETRRHLYCPAGFLNDDWWHRTYFIYGTHFYSGYIGWYFAGRETPAGRLLALDDGVVYGFSYRPEYYKGTTGRKYQLFAATRQDLVPQDPVDYAQAQRRYPHSGNGEYRVELQWGQEVPLLARALAVAGDTVLMAGPPESAMRLMTAFEGKKGGVLQASSTGDGSALASYRLDGLPVHDGMAVANGRLYISTEDGRLLCAGDPADAPAGAPQFMREAVVGAEQVAGDPKEPGFTGHWKLDGEEEELALDSSGVGNHGDVYGGWVEGDFGTCLRLTGSPGALTIADGPGWHFGAEDFSISYWVKPDKLDTRIIGKEDFPAKWWVFNLLADGRLEMVLGETHEATKTVRPTSKTPLSMDRWNHVVYVVDRSNREVRAYIDGALDSTTEIPENLDGSLSVEGTGIMIPSAHKPFSGLFDELRVYKRALSADEVTSAYDGQASKRGSVACEPR